MTSEPTTAAGRALPGLIEANLTMVTDPFQRRELVHETLRNGIAAIEAEALAADGHGDHPRDSYLYQGCPRCAQFREQARAAAERDVAALREALETVDRSRIWHRSDVIGIPGYWGISETAVHAMVATLANPAAEPRWPSGPDAERELAAALDRHGFDNVSGGAGISLPKLARSILAALQEKRDPGE